VIHITIIGKKGFDMRIYLDNCCFSREQFDYTQWQQEHFDKMTPTEIDMESKQYAQTHPFKGNAKTVL
jgi:hypothetical protein